MRLVLALVASLGVGCTYDPTRRGDDVPGDGDGPYVLPPAELIPGGGIHDGPIVAGMNITVIDVETNAPVANAMVSVGAFSGVTNPAGIFVADASLAGRQRVLVSATGYRTEEWIGVNGANVTVPLAPTVLPFGTASGVITNFGSFSINPAVGHTRRGRVGYSQDDRETTRANDIDTPARMNECTGATCNVSVRSRTGTVSLIAIITDRFDNLTGTPDDDTEQLVGWAYRGGVTITDAIVTPNQNLEPIAPANLNPVTVGYGTLPSEAPFSFSIVGIELGATESVTLPTLVGSAISAPKLSAIAGATSYRLTAFAFSADGSVLIAAIRRGSSTTDLAAGTWLAAAPVIATVTDTSFEPVVGANIYRVLYRDENIDTDLYEALIFDDTRSVTLPAGITVPTSNLDVTVEAIGSTIDVTDFGFDADSTKILDAAFRTIDVN